MKIKAIICLIILLTVFTPQVSAWWDADWLDRIPFSINDTESGVQTDYPIKVNLSQYPVNSSSLRIVDEDTNSLVPHFQSNITNNLCYEFWFNCSNTDHDYSIYYTNNNSNSVSNPQTTFALYETFDNLDNWSSDLAPYGTASVSGGKLIIGSNDAGPSGSDGDAMIVSDRDISYNTLIEIYGNKYENEWYPRLYLSGWASGFNAGDGAPDNYLGARIGITGSAAGTPDWHGYEVYEDSTERDSSVSQSDAFPFYIQIWKDDNYFYTYFGTDNASMSQKTVFEPVHTWNSGKIAISATGPGDRNNKFYVYHCIARKYVADEPSYSLGTPEKNHIRYNTTVEVENVITAEGGIYVDSSHTSTDWVATSVAVNATILMYTDYSDGSGSFNVTNGVIDTIEVTNLSNNDLIVLYEGSEIIEVGLVEDNSYIFTTNIDNGSYEIATFSYNGVTGVHGFVYEGLSGYNTPLSDVIVEIYNTTWSDSTITDSGGYYIFEDLTNTTYTLIFKKDRYNDVNYQYITPATGNMYYKSVYMQKATGDYYSRHYVTFQLSNIWGHNYENINTVVYKDNNDIIESGQTGSDGRITFALFEDTFYRITFINATQSISESMSLYPRDNYYKIYITGFDFSPSDKEMRDTVNWYYSKNDHNNTFSWLNFSYYDSENKTTFIEYWINDSDRENIFYTNSTYPCNNSQVWRSDNLVNSENTTYLVHFSAIHPDYPELQHSGQEVISFFTGRLIELMFDEQWHYTLVSVIILIFIASLFSAVNVGLGAILTCLAAIFLQYLNWLPISTIGYVSLVLATIMAITYQLRRSEVAP